MKILPDTINFLKLVTAAIILAALPINTIAADDISDMKARIGSLEKELTQMRNLLEQSMDNSATRKEVQELKEEVKVTRANQVEFKTYDSKVHLSGYASAGYTTEDEDGNDSFGQVKFAPIFHFGYKDLFLLESELEIEVDELGETEFALEYLTVDWFMNDYATLIAGKFLSPIGQFQQNLHPSWINKMPSNPVGFGHGGATPLAEVGVQVRGGFELPMFHDSSLINYSLFVGNGPELELEGHHDDEGAEEGHDEGAEEEEEEESEIEGIETEGFGRDIDDNKVFGGRIGFLPIPNMEIGFSGATGDVALENDVDRDYEVLGADFFGRWKNLDVRAEWIQHKVGANESSIAPEGQEWEAWYVQGSYKLLPTKIELVARYSDFDSTHASQARNQWAFGINYLFANQAMVKLAYEINDAFTGLPADENRLMLQLAYGF